MSNDAVHDWIVPYLVGPVNADCVEGALRILSEELRRRLCFAPPTVSKLRVEPRCRWPALSAPFADEPVAVVTHKRDGAVRRGSKRLQVHRRLLDILSATRAPDFDPEVVDFEDLMDQLMRQGGFDFPELRASDASLVLEALREMGLASKSAPTARKTRRGCRGGQSVKSCRQRRITPWVEPSPGGVAPLASKHRKAFHFVGYPPPR